MSAKLSSRRKCNRSKRSEIWRLRTGKIISATRKTQVYSAKTSMTLAARLNATCYARHLRVIVTNNGKSMGKNKQRNSNDNFDDNSDDNYITRISVEFSKQGSIEITRRTE